MTPTEYSRQFLEDIIQQYTKHPGGRTLRYQIRLGGSNCEDIEAMHEHELHLTALNQLKEEGIIKDYKIDEVEVFGWSELDYYVALCLVNKERLCEFMKEDGLIVIQADENICAVTLKDGKLVLHLDTGVIRLNKIQAEISPNSEEFKILHKLVTSPGYFVSYKKLIRGSEITKTSKRNLTFVIRNLKERLGILPVKSSVNRDIFKNIKSHGYKLVA